MAKRTSIWAYGIAVGLVGAGVAASNGCDNTEFINEGIPFSEMPADLAEALCSSIETCLDGPSLILTDQCRDRATPALEQGWGPAVGAGIDDKRIEYFAQSASACLDAIAGCGNDQQPPPACMATFTGQIALGGECKVSLDCDGDAFCAADAMCPGICTEWGGESADCDDDQDCKRDFRCVNDKCAATGGEGSECDSFDDCNYDLECVEVEGTGKCVDVRDVMTAPEAALCGTFAGGGVGIPAAPFCELPFVCVQDSNGSTKGTCATKVGAGDVCGLAFLSQCPEGYACTGTPGVCEALPTSGDCAQLYFMPACDADYGCTEGGQCVLRQDDGVDCTEDAMCASDACVNDKCAPDFACDPAP